MDLWEAVVVAFRRWYVLVPTLVVGVLVALSVAGSVSPVHEAGATIQYLPPAVSILDQETAFQVQANPYSDLRSLALATELAAESENLTSELRDQGFDADFTLEIDRRAPVLTITTMSTSPASALQTLDALVEFAVDEAQIRQEQQFVGGDPEFYVVADVPTRDTSTSIDMTSRTRARVLLLAVAVVVAVGAAVAVESVLSAVRRRRGGGSVESAEPDVVWFGVPLRGGQSPPQVEPPSQPYLAPAPEEPAQLTGTTGDGVDDRPARGESRWSR